MGERPAFIVGVLLTLAMLFTASVATAADAEDAPKGELKIVATLFPQYDFARQIAKNRASVRLLLPPGAESHSFEPTPSDIKAIAAADIFIYTGAEMEPWAKRLVDASALPSGVVIVDASHGIDLIDIQQSENPDAEHIHAPDHETHKNTPAHKPDGPDGDDEAENNGDRPKHDTKGPKHAAHNHNSDPHIWLDPVMAGLMVDNIGQALAEKDPDNAPFYLQNTLALCEELDKLDANFAARVASLPRRLLVFGDHFAFAYFFSRYGLKSVSPYNSCAPGSEPGLRAVIDTINVVKQEKIKYVYVEAMTTSRMASVISNETGADILYVGSLHNPPLEQQLAGITYQSVMQGNMDAFAKGLEE